MQMEFLGSFNDQGKTLMRGKVSEKNSMVFGMYQIWIYVFG